MRKIGKFLAVTAISIMAVCVPAQASEIAPEGTAAPTVTSVPVQPTAAPARKKGLVKEGKKYVYYDKKGNKLKNKVALIVEENTLIENYLNDNNIKYSYITKLSYRID